MGDNTNNKQEEIEMDNAAAAKVKYRVAQPTDIFAIYELEKLSYPKEEAASKNTLQYRQHHAAKFFFVAVLHEDCEEIHYDDDDEDEIIGYICATRYDLDSQEITDIGPSDIPKTHQPHTPTLIVHSVVVKEEYQRQGIGSSLIKHYIDQLNITNMTLEKPISKVALFAKSHLLTFFIHCGFSVICPAKIPPPPPQQQSSSKEKEEKSTKSMGNNQKYYLELSIQPDYRSISENIGRIVGASSFSSSNNKGKNNRGSKGKECYIVDAFAATSGSGNPAAVVKLPPDTDPQLQSKWMQLVAAEFNLSETAFIWPIASTTSTTTSNTSNSTIGGSGGSSSHGDADEIHWNIRYYTPTSEIPLCGHATLASASILYMTLPGGNNIKESKVVFHASEDIVSMELATTTATSKSIPSTTNDTTLTSTTSSSTSSSSQSQQQEQQKEQPIRIVMEFPIKPAKQITTQQDLSAVKMMLKSTFPKCCWDGNVKNWDTSILYVGISEIGDVLVELTPETFEEIGFVDESLNLKALLEWDGYSRGVIVCCLNPDVVATKQQQGSSSSDDVETGCNNGSSGVGDDGNNNQTTSSTGGTSNSSVVVVPDFYSRFFGPKAGIPEDPVTGSAHCVLGPYFSKKLNKTKIVGKQKSKRQGIVECEMTDHETVRLTGTAIPTVNGTLWM